MTLDVRSTSFARRLRGEAVPGVSILVEARDGSTSATQIVVTEAEALELLDRLMALLRVPGWVAKLVRTFARGLLK